MHIIPKNVKYIINNKYYDIHNIGIYIKYIYNINEKQMVILIFYL